MSTATGGHTGRAIYTGLTAAGSSQATALPLAGRGDSVQEITTVGSSTGVLLPPPILPMRVEVVNQGTHDLSVYPQVGGTIDNGSANAAVTITAGNAKVFEASSLANWYTVSTTAGGGSGTVTSVTFTGDGTVLSSTPSAAVTTSGTVTAALANANANTVIAGPASGSAAALAARALVVADLPSGTAYQVFEQITPVQVSATSGTTALSSDTNARGSRTIPAGALNSRGAVLEIEIAGDLSTASSPQAAALNLYLGSTVIACTVNGTQAGSKTNLGWYGRIRVVTASTGSSGTINTFGFVSATAVAWNNASTTTFVNASALNTQASGTPATIDLTAAQTVDLKVNYTGAVAGNVCNLYCLGVKLTK